MNGLDLAIERGVRRRARTLVRQTPRREPRVTLMCRYTPCPNLETGTWRYDRDGAVLVCFPDERYADNPMKRALLRDVV